MTHYRKTISEDQATLIKNLLAKNTSIQKIINALSEQGTKVSSKYIYDNFKRGNYELKSKKFPAVKRVVEVKEKKVYINKKDLRGWELYHETEAQGICN